MIELIATSPAASSRLPNARSFQISTIAMHGAIPTTIRPVRSSGRSDRNTDARANISRGPTSQLNARVTATARSRVTSPPTRRYRTLASTGYIIASNPRAMGSDTVSTFTASMVSSRPGTSRPSSNPAAIAAPIHAGR